MHGGYYMNVPQKVQIDFECAESDDDVRSFPVHKMPLMLWEQVPRISGIWNNRHVLTWATKHACARLYQTFLEEEEGESNSPPEGEETDRPPEDSEESSPNQDFYTPISPDKKGPSIISIIIWSG